MSLFAPGAWTNKNLPLHFRQISDEIAAFGAQFNTPIVSYRDPSLPLFTKLSTKKQQRALTRISCQRDFFLIASEEGLHPNSPKLIWRALARMGMIPQSDIFDKIDEEDTVEVYHGDGTSSFKNLKFFEFISLSIEELYTLTWVEMWSLSFTTYLMFLELTTKMKLARYDRTFTPRFNRYHVGEKLGEGRQFDIHLKWISPISHNGEKKALLTVNKSSFATKIR